MQMVKMLIYTVGHLNPKPVDPVMMISLFL